MQTHLYLSDSSLLSLTYYSDLVLCYHKIQGLVGCTCCLSNTKRYFERYDFRRKNRQAKHSRKANKNAHEKKYFYLHSSIQRAGIKILCIIRFSFRFSRFFFFFVKYKSDKNIEVLNVDALYKTFEFILIKLCQFFERNRKRTCFFFLPINLHYIPVIFIQTFENNQNFFGVHPYKYTSSKAIALNCYQHHPPSVQIYYTCLIQ